MRTKRVKQFQHVNHPDGNQSVFCLTEDGILYQRSTHGCWCEIDGPEDDRPLPISPTRMPKK
jgi:hypothetical protein